MYNLLYEIEIVLVATCVLLSYMNLVIKYHKYCGI